MTENDDAARLVTLNTVGTRVEFRRQYGNGSSGTVLGIAARHVDGWRFYPRVPGRRPSRKGWPTLERCLPRWVGYPDGCTSRLAP